MKIYFFLLLGLCSCHTQQRSSSIFLNDYVLKYKNLTFSYNNTFYASNKSDGMFKYWKYMKIEKNEILDYVLKNKNRKYHIVGTTQINSNLSLAGYSQGIIIVKREYDLDNLDSIFHSKSYDALTSLNGFEVYTKKESIDKKSMNLRYTVLFKNNDTIHKMVFIDDTNHFPHLDKLACRYFDEYKYFARKPIDIHPFTIDSSLRSNKKYFKSKAKKAQLYLLFFDEQLSLKEKQRIQAFIDDYDK